MGARHSEPQKCSHVDAGQRHQGQGAAGRDGHPGTGHTAPPLLWSFTHEVCRPSSRVGRGTGSYPPQAAPRGLPACSAAVLTHRAALTACRGSGWSVLSVTRSRRGSGLRRPRGVMLDHAVAGRTWGPRAPRRRQWGQSGRRVLWCSRRLHSPGTGTQHLHPCHMTGRPPGRSPGSLGPGSAWSCPRWVFRGACATPPQPQASG